MRACFAICLGAPHPRCMMCCARLRPPCCDSISCCDVMNRGQGNGSLLSSEMSDERRRGGRHVRSRCRMAHKVAGVNVVSNQENRTLAPSGLIVTGRGDAGSEPLDGERLIMTARSATRQPETKGRIHSAAPPNSTNWNTNSFSISNLEKQSNGYLCDRIESPYRYTPETN